MMKRLLRFCHGFASKDRRQQGAHERAAGRSRHRLKNWVGLLLIAVLLLLSLDMVLTSPVPVFAAGAPPTNLVATGISAGQINLTWNDNSNGQTGFRIERCSNDAFEGTFDYWDVAAGVTAFSDTTTAVGNLYYYHVYASPKTPDSVPSNVVEVSTYAPAQPIVTVTHLSSNRVDLAWTSDPEASGTWSGGATFQVECATGNPITEWITIAASLTYPTTSYSDTTVAASTDYHYRVSATNVMGSSQSAPPTDVTTPSADASPEITVKWNGTEIVNLGSVIDFGNTEVEIEAVEVFTIENTGDAPLNLLGPGFKVVIGGDDALDFSVPAQPPSPILPNNSVPVAVTFRPSSPGQKTATVSIANDDPDGDENPYTFTIRGNATAPPAVIDVTRPSGWESWVVGSFQSITWDSFNVTGLIDIAISRDNGSTWAIIGNNTANDSEYLWIVTGPVTAQAIIKVSSVDAPSVFGESDPLIVVASEIKVSYNGVEIIAGDLFPSTVDGTDFGDVEANDGTTSREFTITNTGTANLDLTGYPATVVISGDLPLYFSVSKAAANDVLLPGGDATTFEITFDPKALGAFNAQITIESNDVDESPYTFAISGNGTPNPVPVAVDDAYSVNEDGILEVYAPGILSNDTDDDTLVAIHVAGPEHGILYRYGTDIDISIGYFRYTPAPDYCGPDSFTYKVYDGLAESNIATVSITVTAVNDAPVAENDGYVTNEDTTLVVLGVGILVNDIDVDGNFLTATVSGGVTHGTLTAFPGNGSFTYTPNANWFGTDSFTYKANDGTVDSNVAMVTITVYSVNDVPVVNDDTYTVAENGVLTVPAPGVLGNDTDADGVLTVIAYSNPARGTFIHNSNGNFTYTPNPNWNGTDYFTYLASDGELSIWATVSITVTSVTDTYTITASAGSNGSITPSGAVSVNDGVSQEFTVTPNTLYHVDTVTVDGSLASLTDGKYTFPNVTADHTITVTFAADKLTPTVTVTGGTFIYDGKPHQAKAKATGAGGVSVSGTFIFIYTGMGGTTYGPASKPPIDVGGYHVDISFISSDPNYANATGSGTIIIISATTALKITTASLPTGTVGVWYSTTLQASGGSNTGYTWSIVSGSIDRLTLDPPTGTISGKPTKASTLNFKVMVTDSSGNTATTSFAIKINSK